MDYKSLFWLPLVTYTVLNETIVRYNRGFSSYYGGCYSCRKTYEH